MPSRDAFFIEEEEEEEAHVDLYASAKSEERTERKTDVSVCHVEMSSSILE